MKPERAKADKQLLEERALPAGTPSGAKAQGSHRRAQAGSQLREVTHCKSFPWVERPHHHSTPPHPKGLVASTQSLIGVFSNSVVCLVPY